MASKIMRYEKTIVKTSVLGTMMSLVPLVALELEQEDQVTGRLSARRIHEEK